MPPVPSLGTPREWAFDLAAATSFGVFLGVIGPFGSFYAGPVEARAAYWIANVWVGFILLSLLVRLTAPWADRHQVPRTLAVALAVAMGAAPLTGLIALLDIAFDARRPHAPAGWLELYGQCLVIAEPLSLIYLRLRPARMTPARGGEAPSGDPPGPATESRSVLDRIPARLGRELLCLQMEDHYVRAHTPLGSDLILISMREAVAALRDIDGLQVHRSFWVARAAVVRSVQNGRNLSLLLTNGLEAPVSRSSVARLRAAGWIPGPGA